MKNILFCFSILASFFLLQQIALAKNVSWGNYYSYDTKLSMHISKEPPNTESTNWSLSVTISDKDHKEVCSLSQEFNYENSSTATGNGYTFTFSELSPALIITPTDEEGKEADLSCGYAITGTYANLCPEVSSDIKQMTVKIVNVYDPAETVPRSITYEYEGKEIYNTIPYASVGFFKTLVGKTVNVRYRLEQYYDDHDSYCAQEKVFYMVDGVSLSD